MRTLVTGATGLLGNNLVRLLLERGEAVRVLERFTSDRRALQGLEIERVIGDLRVAESVERACRGIDRVFHCGAKVQVGWTGLREQREVNVVGTSNVAAAARAVGLRMVHVSSVDA